MNGAHGLAAGKGDQLQQGVPVLAPGEVITADIVDYLRSGIEAGMLIPDSADPTLKTLRVRTR